VSRLEASIRSESHSPSFATLRKYAHACGKRLVIQDGLTDLRRVPLNTRASPWSGVTPFFLHGNR